MNEFEIWAYRGLISALLLLFYWLVRYGIKRFNQKFDELINAVNKQNDQAIKQSGEILNLTKRVDTCCKRMDDHSKRVRTLEVKQAKNL